MVVTFQVLMTLVSIVDTSAQTKVKRLTLVARHGDQGGHLLYDSTHMKGKL